VAGDGHHGLVAEVQFVGDAGGEFDAGRREGRHAPTVRLYLLVGG
jgi:hypothetical protein